MLRAVRSEGGGVCEGQARVVRWQQLQCQRQGLAATTADPDAGLCPREPPEGPRRQREGAPAAAAFATAVVDVRRKDL
eukprot:COSAG05_NODE_3759_length_1854_cov_1.625071_2_plen_78_part_00